MRTNTLVTAVKIAVAVGSIAWGAPARAGVTLGASAAYTHLSYPNLDDVTNDVVGIPGAQQWGQSGIRVGYLPSTGIWDLVVDLGLFYRTGTFGGDEHQLQIFPQLQASAGSARAIRPFVNLGLGFINEEASLTSASSATATRPVFGAGVGVRKPVCENHGLIRLELRYDHIVEQTKDLGPTSSITFPSTNLISLKLGFDLVLAQ